MIYKHYIYISEDSAVLSIHQQLPTHQWSPSGWNKITALNSEYKPKFNLNGTLSMFATPESTQMK